MKKLILITKYFPYGNDTGEMYLRTEIDILAKEFEEILIFSLDAIKMQMEIEIPNNVIVFSLGNEEPRIKQYLYGTIKRVFLQGESEVQEERKNISFLQNIFLSYFMAKVDKRMKNLKDFVSCSSEEITIYAYRFFDAAYLAIKLEEIYYPNAILICRAHGYDLYEEQNIFKYLPLRRYMLGKLDKVLPCSKNGMSYLKEKYPELENHIEYSYLGSSDFASNRLAENPEKIELISCSNVIPIKQVEKIAAVVREISKYKAVHWTHIGTGKLLDKIKDENSEWVKKGIISFKGACSHEDVINNYKNNYYDIFINLSISEGIPQAIMEAISFGIPVIATNVGGNAEIVKENISGYVVDVNTDVKKIADIIIKHKNMSIERQNKFRETTREFWCTNFDSKINAQKFVNVIKNTWATNNEKLDLQNL